VYTVPIKDLFILEGRVPELDSLVHRAASLALANRDQLAYTLAAVASEVRLARFLLQWSQRMVFNGQSPWRFFLPMKRRDIASHLGLAHETVSRSFGTLAESGYVSVNNREIEILDLDALKAYTVGTRRPGEKQGRGAEVMKLRPRLPDRALQMGT
jgi:CRP/FNR family transcriptional regulator